MDFPEFDGDDFARCLYILWPSRTCTINRQDAANGLGVSLTTVQRWLTGKQRVPQSAWQLTWLLASGELPDAHGWPGWLFTTRWNDAIGQYQHHLVAPNGVEYSASEILSWHFQYQRLALLSREVQTLRQKPIPGPVINLHEASEKLSTARSALKELAEHLEIPEQLNCQQGVV